MNQGGKRASWIGSALALLTWFCGGGGVLESTSAKRFLLSLCCLLPAMAMPGPASGQAYQVVDLGVGADYFPTALNNQGQVLLTNTKLNVPTIGGILQASSDVGLDWKGAASVLWDNGRTLAIGLLPDGTYSRGFGLNDAGQVVGVGDTSVTWALPSPITFASPHAFVWQGGTMTDLDPSTYTQPDGFVYQFFPGGSVATGINNQGAVAGWMYTPAPSGGDLQLTFHAFRTAAGSPINRNTDDLTLSAGADIFSHAWFINNAGQVLGTIGPPGSAAAYFLSGGAAAPPIPSPPGAGVYAMNDRGELVGVLGDGSGGGKGFLYSPGGGMKELPIPGGGSALGINNREQVVGQGTVQGQFRAVLVENGESVVLDDRLLPKSGWELKSANAINDKGQIVGWGLHEGQFALFSLTPEDLELTLRLQPAAGCGGETTKATLQLQPPAPAGGIEVHLTATPELMGLPETVTFDEGETEKAFEVTAPSAAETVTYKIEAAINSDSGQPIVSAAADLGVDAPELTGIKLSDNEVCSDDQPIGTVTLSCAAPPEGLVVTLQSKTSSPLQLTVPPSVKVEAGKTSATFPITPGFYNSKFSEESVTISVGYRGVTRSTELMVQPTIDSVKLMPHSVAAGEAATATIHLNCMAPKGGRVVVVTSMDPSIAFVNADHPDQPFILVAPEGSDTLLARVQTRPVTASQMVTIGASTPASSDSDDLTVMPGGKQP